MPQSILTLPTGLLQGCDVVETSRTVGDLIGYWQDDDSARQQSSELLYVTQTWLPVPDGTEGAILWGNTALMPGSVGGEYFMTRGHWHVKRDRCEICITVSGTGVLLLMDEERRCRQEVMEPGTTHYVEGALAHRTINTGEEPLVFLCAWPADCGHEYDEIWRNGFSQRLTRG